ncbi:MAG: transcriptional regulator LysR family [Novosphingobium sp.]|nr:transcriptional regulator LysR family [Novosphingobium sp.]
MDRFEALHTLLRVVDSGSFSAAARARGVGQSTISKQIAALESHLGAQLVRRSSRRLQLTDAGQEFYESALRLMGDLEQAESRLGRRLVSPSGLVKVAMAPVFSSIHVLPHLDAFFARYPDIDVEIQIAHQSGNLVDSGVDVAIHNGPLSDSALFARPLASTPVVTVATPAYLERYGVPRRVRDLERHRCVIFAPQSLPRAWGFLEDGGDVMHRPQGRIRTHDAEQIRAAVMCGLGLAHAPGWLFAHELEDGRVVRVLQDAAPPDLAISAVYPGGRRLPSKVRVFIDFVAESLVESSYLSRRT